MFDPRQGLLHPTGEIFFASACCLVWIEHSLG